MPSIPQAQKQDLQEGNLDTEGVSKSSFEPIKLDATTKAVVDIAGYFAKTAQENLDKSGATSTGGLADSIDPKKAVVDGQKVSVDIMAADYYDFVNKGVSGAKSGGTGPYKFKNSFPNTKMKEKLKGWGKLNMSKVMASEAWRSYSTLKQAKNIEAKGNKIKQAVPDAAKLDAWAWGKATSVKKYGLPATHFWDKAREQTIEAMGSVIGAGIKIDIVNAIKSDLV